jgi:hypothetical protein
MNDSSSGISAADSVTTEAAVMRKLLLQIEWQPQIDNDGCPVSDGCDCLFCNGMKTKHAGGHAENCPLAAALAGAAGKSLLEELVALRKTVQLRTAEYELVNGRRETQAARIEQLEKDLAECFRLSGADPDGNEDWRLAPRAVAEVRRMREDLDVLEETLRWERMG